MTQDLIIETENLKKYFPIKLGFWSTLFSKELPFVRAVDNISFKIQKKELIALVGESGCGKTTTGKLLVKLIEPTMGKIIFKGTDITFLADKEMRSLRGEMQIIFQDPYESLNPRMSAYDIISEPLNLLHQHLTSNQVHEKVVKTMEAMELVPVEEFLYRFPHELSGGQRQRIAIARAFVVDPDFIVADEPVSMLDASIRSEVTKLMLDLVRSTKCSFLYITHDIALARYICHRMAVMYLGQIMEKGPTEELIKKPFHPYTEALLAAIPVPDPTARRIEVVIKGEVPSATNPPPGCRFHPRCPYAKDVCRKKNPVLTKIGKNRYVACHFPLT